jgi:hypothetical protein
MLITDHERLTRKFFRQVNSPQLLRRFFRGFGVGDAMELGADPTCDEIHEAWDQLDSPNRTAVKEALCRMNDIAREKGRYTLHIRAEQCGLEGYRDLTLPKLAMTLFLEHRAVFDAAYDFYVLEKTEGLHTLLGRQAVPCKPTAGRLDRFKAELSKALRRDAHGPHLLVEPGPPHPEKWIAVIPHETYVRPDHEFDEHSEITTRERRPVYEMVLIYYPETGVLKLKAGRGKRKIEQVAALFATEVLGQGLAFFQVCQVVSFDPLLDPEFSFAREPEDEFQWAEPCEIKYRKLSNTDVEHTVQCKEVRYGKPGILVALAAEGVDISEIEILGLKICFKFPRNNRDTKTVELAIPNRVHLDETDRDRYIESVLARWGFIDYAAKDRLARAGVTE